MRESPRTWCECFDEYIRKLGFIRSESDYCLYSKYEKGETIFLPRSSIRRPNSCTSLIRNWSQ